MYHRFEDGRYPSTSTSKENFYSQLSFLKENNFKVLPIKKLIDFFYNKKPLPPRSVFITVDDAYKSFYNYAFPILKEFDYPFSIFLSTSFVEEEKKNDFMNWKMIKEIKENKGDILNHSHKHESFIKQTLEDVEEDNLLARKILIKNLGEVEKIISYPYGESNESIQKIVKGLGYKIALSQHSSPISFTENKFNLPRFSINDEYGEIKRFKQIVNSRPMVFNFFEILNGEDNESLEIKFKKKFNPITINCFINDGTLFKEIDEELIKIKLTKLKKNKRYRLNCTTFKNKTLYWYGHMIIKEKEKFFF